MRFVGLYCVNYFVCTVSRKVVKGLITRNLKDACKTDFPCVQSSGVLDLPPSKEVGHYLC